MSAYALISSTIGSYRILLIGVAEGMQPLASKAYGASQNGNATPAERIAAYDEIRHIRNKAIRTAIAASVLLFLFTIATASFYPALYGYQETLLLPAITRLCLPLPSSSLPAS